MAEMTPADWAMRPLRKYADFSGRAPRAEYWWFYFATFLAGLAFDQLDRIAGDAGFIGGIFSLGILVPWIAVSIRRLHDIGRTGWWLLTFLAPAVFIGIGFAMDPLQLDDSTDLSPPIIAGMIAMLGVTILLFIFTVLPGTQGRNRYGPDPYGPDHLEEVFA